MNAPVDVDQLAALRALRRGFGDVQVLEVVEGDGLLEQLRKYPRGTLAMLREAEAGPCARPGRPG